MASFTLPQLETLSSCYSAISAKQRLAIRVFNLNRSLGGDSTVYTLEQLVNLSRCYMPYSEGQLDAMLTFLTSSVAQAP